jgi:hypothetical protein
VPSFAREQRPRAAYSVLCEWLSIVALSIAIVIVAMPRWSHEACRS